MLEWENKQNTWGEFRFATREKAHEENKLCAEKIKFRESE